MQRALCFRRFIAVRTEVICDSELLLIVSILYFNDVSNSRLVALIECMIVEMPMAEAARSKAQVCGRSLMGLQVRIPPGAWMSVCCERCVLSDRGLCVGMITRPEESYRLWCV